MKGLSDEARHRQPGGFTPTGRSLIPPALALAAWAADHVPEIEAARAAVDPR
ncbi:hypothetical protein GCM10022221_72390 [Actinocorallia aurea]